MPDRRPTAEDAADLAATPLLPFPDPERAGARRAETSGPSLAPAARDLERALAAQLERPVRVRYGRSTSSPVVARTPTRTELTRDPDLARGLVLRLHRAFADAPEDVLAALGRWLAVGRGARAACARLDRWIAEELPRHTPAPRAVRLAPRGAFHDLGELRAELLRGEFAGAFADGREPPAVTWGPRRRSRARRSLRLGTYEAARHLVRLHPVLDQPGVPRWFVRFILFHELLHAALGPERDASGRPRHHGPRFRAIEEAHPDHERALRWERRHLGALLRSARGGRPLRPLSARAHR